MFQINMAVYGGDVYYQLEEVGYTPFLLSVDAYSLKF